MCIFSESKGEDMHLKSRGSGYMYLQAFQVNRKVVGTGFKRRPESGKGRGEGVSFWNEPKLEKQASWVDRKIGKGKLSKLTSKIKEKKTEREKSFVF